MSALSKPRLYIELEYCPYDLKEFIKRFKNRRLPLIVVQHIVADIVRGLFHCHQNRIIHRDLKPTNILLQISTDISYVRQNISEGIFDSTWLVAKLADFGLARMHHAPGGNLTHEVVTLWYRAPEILLGHDAYGPAVDIWSIGCIASELVSGRALFAGDTEISTLFRIFEFCGTPNEHVWKGISTYPQHAHQWPRWEPLEDRWARLRPHAALPSSSDSIIWGQLVDFMEKTLTLNPSSRPTVHELMYHPLVQDVMSNRMSTGYDDQSYIHST